MGINRALNFTSSVCLPPPMAWSGLAQLCGMDCCKVTECPPAPNNITLHPLHPLPHTYARSLTAIMKPQQMAGDKRCVSVSGCHLFQHPLTFSSEPHNSLLPLRYSRNPLRLLSHPTFPTLNHAYTSLNVPLNCNKLQRLHHPLFMQVQRFSLDFSLLARQAPLMQRHQPK